METIDRRRMVRGILCGALAAAGFALMPGATEAQVVVGPHHRHHWHHHHHRRRHHRRWVCWWHRGRRVCGWR